MAENMADEETRTDLSGEQTEKLLQFHDLSGLDDMVQCREILERHGWDIEVAVQSRFAEEEGRGNVYEAITARSEPRTPPVDAHPHNQRVYTVSHHRTQTWGQWGYFVVLFPFRFFYTTVLDLLRFCYRLLRPDPRRVVSDPVGDVRAFVAHFIEAYGSTHPQFYDGTYSQALNTAKSDLKFLLVYLHGDDHQDTPDFCRQTLCNNEVVEFLNDSLIFWACNTNSPEGYRVSQALRENTYPFLALVVLRQHRMTVVARLEGPITAEFLISRLRRLMNENEASLVAARVDREERSFNQSLRAEQDEAYEESLRADQEKARLRQQELDREQMVQKELEFQQEQEKRRLEEIVKKKEELREKMPPEPDEDDPRAIRILLKLPNGMRLERRFVKDQSLKHLFNFVFVHEAAPDDFQIVTNFPRKVLPCGSVEEEYDEVPSFEDMGLGKSELLFVHDNEA